jgi:hypothetical protein
MIVAAKFAKANIGHRSQYSTGRHIERLREHLKFEPDPKLRATIRAQLAAFEHPPAGSHD